MVILLCPSGPGIGFVGGMDRRFFYNLLQALLRKGICRCAERTAAEGLGTLE